MEFVDQIDDSDEMIVIMMSKYLSIKKLHFFDRYRNGLRKGELESGFKFINPNEKEDRLGESFHV